MCRSTANYSNHSNRMFKLELSRISKNVRHLKYEQGLTIQQIAEGTGLSGAAVASICSGRDKNPTVKTVLKLAKFFNVSVMDLFA